MSLISSSGVASPKSKEWTWTLRMKRGKVTCWNFSWMNARIFSAKSLPSGPETSLSQLMSTDITLGWLGACLSEDLDWRRYKGKIDTQSM